MSGFFCSILQIAPHVLYSLYLSGKRALHRQNQAVRRVHLGLSEALRRQTVKMTPHLQFPNEI
jgi:hypothetical protein